MAPEETLGFSTVRGAEMVSQGTPVVGGTEHGSSMTSQAGAVYSVVMEDAAQFVYTF
ncbi:hypothetical protein ACQP1G_25000 [Nocardia sp. CA-107356]|uniref:hypothetical protein n=1 Tax=Nocardia sp. CA-107356 TaxID=3239972 RepID=UPI003D90D32F